jgi:hypothetical protein
MVRRDRNKYECELGQRSAAKLLSKEEAGAMQRAATAISTVQEAQFYARPTRHGIIKCYREFVVGRPVCRHFYRWWW